MNSTTQNGSFNTLNNASRGNYGSVKLHSLENLHPNPSPSIYDKCCSICKSSMKRESLLLLLSMVLLMVATATERVTYKITVDRMLPYKFVMVEIIFLLSALLFGCVTFYKIFFTTEITPQMREFPQNKIFVMALIDTIQFIWMTFSASAVSPIMTVILLHASTIFIVLGARFTFPNRNYSQVHWYGISLITISIVICVVRAVVHYIIDTKYGGYRSMMTLVYVGSASIQGLSTLYKEKSIIDWGQPIDIYLLSTWLFCYQFFMTFIISLILYLIQDILGYAPFETLYENVYDGWACFLGYDTGDVEYDYDDIIIVNCSDSIWLITSYVLSNLLVLVSVNSVLQLSNQLVGRAMAAAILAAFVVLWSYDAYINSYEADGFFGSSVGYTDIIVVIVLLIGMETYGQNPEPNVETITNFSPSSEKTEAFKPPHT